MSISICSDGHDEVMYDSKLCPACEYGNSEYKRGLDEGYTDGYEEGRQDGCEND